MVRILLRELLFYKDWNQADLVRATKIRKNTISDYYNNWATSIKLEHIDLICAALECDMSDLLEYAPEEDIQLYSRSNGKPVQKEKQE